ncbi:hypothetical protein BGZ95_010671 [Linnemannia exigua]|uniref:Cas12f1-like TNB domain-containing protein n=1 Tax=Linnemannia exigua TaxID=604196 RepID=A0AAD4DD18_9FUNG|nr:hypothetical protein BGZ95_010671 [Linnemannia exigua]
MGVKNAWPFVRKKGNVPVAQPKVLPVSPESKIRVDVCSTHNTLIRNLYGNTTDLNTAHLKLESCLKKIGDKTRVRYYIDGEPAVEKRQTHADRHQGRQNAVDKAATAITKLESRLVAKQRIRKHHIADAYKNLRLAFHWRLEHRSSFVEYMSNEGYDIVLCPTEADVLIASECQPKDAVMSCDSDLLFYKSIPTVWRPVGPCKARQFVPYEKSALLGDLGLSTTQLTALAILSGNDYTKNIPHLAIYTNAKLIKDLQGGERQNERSIVQQYLSHPRVIRQINKEDGVWTTHSYASACKVFVDMKQDKAESSPSAATGSGSGLSDASVTPPSYESLQEQMMTFMRTFNVSKTEAYKARVAKRTTAISGGLDSHAEPKPVNPFDTLDKPDPSRSHQYRPRYSPKVRFEPSKEQPAPAISAQYKLKPWKEPPEKPNLPEPEKPNLPEPEKKTPTATIKAEINDDNRFGRKEMMDALSFEHPTVTLSLDCLSSNVHGAVKDDSIAKTIVECIRGAVRVAWETKKRCQMLIGLYLEDLFYPSSSPGSPRPAVPVTAISKEDQSILDSLCPRLSSKEMNGDGDDVGPAGDGQDDGSNTPFVRSFLCFLYSGNLPDKSKIGSAVNTFIVRLQDMGHLEKSQGAKTDMLKNVKEYTPSFLVRSVASQLSAELKRHYKYGAKRLSEKVQTMIKKKKLKSDQEVHLTSQEPAIQLFVQANAITGRSWRLSPLSSEGHGYMTFTEIELAAFLHKKDKMHPILKKLIGCKDERRLTQADVICDWLPFQTPGVLIQRLIAPVDPRTPDGDLLRGRQKKDAGIVAAVKVVEPDEMRAHINTLRCKGFDPRAYQEKGYFLRGSIKTDGNDLQLLAYKVRELNSVKFKRYKTEVLPDRLLTTTAGTSDYLTEVHNIFKSAADVEHLLGCTPDDTDKVSYLGLDLGQAFVVGAYGHMPEDKSPKIGKRHRHRRQKKRGSRGRRRRGSGKGKKKSICRIQGERYINLAAKQKAVAQPTLRHRTWMNRQKGADLKTHSSPPTINIESTASSTVDQPSISITESLSISTIESSLAPLRGSAADFAAHVQGREMHKVHLNKFYNDRRFRFKKFKRMSQKARQREFEHLADSLLRMVGGSIGEKKKEEDKVVIGVGMGRFSSSSRLSSLHGTFEAYFINKARSLGYLVVGVHEFYSSKKCPKCEQFVGQNESIRRLYCYHCKKNMHRDVMAGHNIVNILRGHVEQQQRPLYLHPVDKDGHYPWLELPQDAQDSLQQAGSNGSRTGRAGRADCKRQAEGDADAKETGGKRAKTTLAKQKAETTKNKAAAKQLAGQ